MRRNVQEIAFGRVEVGSGVQEFAIGRVLEPYLAARDSSYRKFLHICDASAYTNRERGGPKSAPRRCEWRDRDGRFPYS